MPSRTTLLRIALAVAVLPAFLLAQDGTGQPGKASASAAPKVAKKPIVAVLGASVSAGFIDPRPRADGERNSTVKLARALLELWPEDRVEIRDQSDAFLFLDPGTVGRREVERTIDADVDLVIGIDLPFWFGYGQVRSLDARKAMQDQCFTLLDGLLDKRAVPMLLGDYPDMRGADPDMLPPSAVPSVEDLRVLNQRLRDWAGKHPSVHLFPLAEFVAGARGKGLTARFEDKDQVLGSALLMQGDRLHASRTGVAALTSRIAVALRSILAEDTALCPRDTSFADLAEKVGATVEIEDWLDAQGAPASAGKGGKTGPVPVTSGGKHN